MFEVAITLIGGVAAVQLKPARRRRNAAVVAICVAGVFAMAGPASADQMMMGGAMEPYPNVSAASSHDRTAVRRLFHRTWSNYRKFNTLRKAKLRRYRSRRFDDHLGWPSLRHMRKHGADYWGRVLNPRARQALVWWCRSRKDCTLVAAMYRAPGAVTPPTQTEPAPAARYAGTTGPPQSPAG
jgi:hypothetical protein